MQQKKKKSNTDNNNINLVEIKIFIQLFETFYTSKIVKFKIKLLSVYSNNVFFCTCYIQQT